MVLHALYVGIKCRRNSLEGDDGVRLLRLCTDDTYLRAWEGVCALAGSPLSSPSSAMSGTPNTGASKAYSTHLAVQTDAAKYRGKYKMLKKKVRQIEQVCLVTLIHVPILTQSHRRRTTNFTSRHCE